MDRLAAKQRNRVNKAGGGQGDRATLQAQKRRSGIRPGLKERESSIRRGGEKKKEKAPGLDRKPLKRKKGPSLTTGNLFFGGEPPPPKMRVNRRYSTP